LSCGLTLLMYSIQAAVTAPMPIVQSVACLKASLPEHSSVQIKYANEPKKPQRKPNTDAVLTLTPKNLVPIGSKKNPRSKPLNRAGRANDKMIENIIGFQ
jgi:hypothetical protein